VTEHNPGRPEAAAAIWQWRDRRTRARGVSARSHRVRGVVQGAVGLAIASAVYWLGSPGFGTAVAILAGAILLSALLSPTGLYATLQRLFAWTGQGIGRALTWVMLPPLFYLVFYPFGMLFRRRRRDRMRRFFEPGTATYWEPHDHPIASAGPRDRAF
jgi:hypothetical protein